MTMSNLEALRERVRAASGPDREIDREIAWATLPEEDRLIFDGVKHYPTIYSVKAGQLFHPLHYPIVSDKIGNVTASIDAVVALIERTLPGWWWKCGTCWVSDDACIAPDFNNPAHGERLKAQLFPIEAGSEFDAGFDVDRRPPGNVPLALLEALLSALIALEEPTNG